MTLSQMAIRFLSQINLETNQLQEYHIWVCANLPKKTITTVKQSVYETKTFLGLRLFLSETQYRSDITSKFLYCASISLCSLP